MHMTLRQFRLIVSRSPHQSRVGAVALVYLRRNCKLGSWLCRNARAWCFWPGGGPAVRYLAGIVNFDNKHSFVPVRF